MDNMIELSDIINDLKDRIDEIAEKLDSLEDERADKRQLQMSIQRRYEKYKNLLMRFFENEVGDDEKRMIGIRYQLYDEKRLCGFCMSINI